ncbi:hypothetical protein [Microvirga roseola]|nr:hypothetical protein [Microvirga roseola]
MTANMQELEVLILMALKRAAAQNRPDIVDCLLRALELITEEQRV